MPDRRISRIIVPDHIDAGARSVPARTTRNERCKLMVKDIHERRGVRHPRVHGKGAKVLHVPPHPGSRGRIDGYLQVAGHSGISYAPSSRRSATTGAGRRTPPSQPTATTS